MPDELPEPARVAVTSVSKQYKIMGETSREKLKRDAKRSQTKPRNAKPKIVLEL